MDSIANIEPRFFPLQLYTEKGFCGRHYILGRIIPMQPYCFPPLLQDDLSTLLNIFCLNKKEKHMLLANEVEISLCWLCYPHTSSSNHNCC